MPKQEVGSTKWLGNKMKAKGLQKLRWYCQMCQKQCRDENGFKCHRMSDGHQRQMQLFVQDPNKFMDDFSIEFEEGFMKLMSHTYRGQRVLANTVYCDFISNRHHTHMNSTIWVTLSNFVQYLGRTNQCTIDKTPKGWYISYIDNSPEAKQRAKQAAEQQKLELADSERHEMMLREQVAEGVATGGFQQSEFTELRRQEGDAPIAFALADAERACGNGSTASSSSAPPPASVGSSGQESQGRQEGRPCSRGGRAEGRNVLAEAFVARPSRESSRDAEESPSAMQHTKSRKLSAMESVRLEHEASKHRRLQVGGDLTSSGTDSRPREVHADSLPDDLSLQEQAQLPEAWVAAGLVVKVMHKELADGKYYRKKALIEKVHNRFTADVRIIDSRALIRIEQEMLETVIPNVGKVVRIVKGTHKGFRAVMRAVCIEGFCVSVELEDGTFMEGLGYDEVCKVDDA